MQYKRKLFYEVSNRIKEKEIIVVTGMRRVGKTTLFKMIFEAIESKNKVFFDMGNPLDKKIFEEEDYNNIWENLKTFGVYNKEKTFIFIDEIQINPEITKVVKYLYDHYNVKFFLTGSSSFYLKNLFPESLAGRKIILELFPLDFEEFLIFKGHNKIFYQSFLEKEKNSNKIQFEKVKKLYDEYLDFGGFPQVVLTEEIEKKKEFLLDIFKSYFEKDVGGLADFKEINAFRDLLLLLLKRTGTKLDITKLASEIGVTRASVYSYISFLEKTYFISLISPFTRNLDREISGTKKIYVCDNGIARYIGKTEDGNLLENAVFNNLRKYGQVNYYQKRSGQEIDFILNDMMIALEVKQKGDKNDLIKLQNLSKKLKLNKCYVVSKSFVKGKGYILASNI